MFAPYGSSVTAGSKFITYGGIPWRAKRGGESVHSTRRVGGWRPALTRLGMVVRVHALHQRRLATASHAYDLRTWQAERQRKRGLARSESRTSTTRGFTGGLLEEA
jgi:hypothetical protein